MLGKCFSQVLNTKDVLGIRENRVSRRLFKHLSLNLIISYTLLYNGGGNKALSFQRWTPSLKSLVVNIEQQVFIFSSSCSLLDFISGYSLVCFSSCFTRISRAVCPSVRLFSLGGLISVD